MDRAFSQTEMAELSVTEFGVVVAACNADAHG